MKQQNVFALLLIGLYVTEYCLLNSIGDKIICQNSSIKQRRHLHIFIHKTSIGYNNRSHKDGLVFVLFDFTKPELLSSLKLSIFKTRLSTPHSLLISSNHSNEVETTSELNYNSKNIYIIRTSNLPTYIREKIQKNIIKAYTNRSSAEIVYSALLNHLNDQNKPSSINITNLQLKYNHKSEIIHKENINPFLGHLFEHTIKKQINNEYPVLTLFGNYIRFKLSYEIDFSFDNCNVVNIKTTQIKPDDKNGKNWFRIKSLIYTYKEFNADMLLDRVKQLYLNGLEIYKNDKIKGNIKENKKELDNKYKGIKETKENKETIRVIKGIYPFMVDDKEDFMDFEQLEANLSIKQN